MFSAFVARSSARLIGCSFRSVVALVPSGQEKTVSTFIPSAVIADDHLDMARMIAGKLADDGWSTRVAESGHAAVAAIASAPPDLVITDLRMPGIDGFGVLEAARGTCAVIVMSAFGDIDVAVEAMRRGAWHYVAKPVRLAELVRQARRALEQRPGDLGLVGESEPMQALAGAIRRVARSAAPVLIRGESGTGKELVARAIHAAGARRDAPFIALNCAAMPEALVEDELFGHVRGAFTGAVADRPGLFQLADRGTLFLDEIGDMPPATQAKLLRVLQDREVRAVGASTSRRVDVRVIAATHRDLEQRVESGAFRQDLLYRLAVLPITVPALRDRPSDVPALVAHFLSRARARTPEATLLELDADALAALAAHSWPGNVRELENVIERLVVLAVDPICRLDDLRALGLVESRPAFRRDRLVSLRELEAEYISFVLEQCSSNKTRACEILGIDPSTLYRRTRGLAAQAAQHGVGRCLDARLIGDERAIDRDEIGRRRRE
jgi:two-component system response regulator HydG